MDLQIERVLSIVDPARRTAIKKLIAIGFAVPTISSFAVRDLAYATVGSPGTSTKTAPPTTAPPPPTSVFTTTTTI